MADQGAATYDASTARTGVLAGYRVLDCSIAMAGPFAAQRLGDLGADVVKIEPPSGEWQRNAPAGGATGRAINVSFLSLNRNKRSVAVDLKAPDAPEVMRALVESADVFLQNYRPGVAKRLGVDYETLREINPALVYVSISGYGEDGPYAQRPGQDLLLQAMSGAMLSSGREGDPPQAAGQYLVDAVTASTAFEGVLAALLHRERTGEGQLVRVNMLDAIVTLQMQELSVYAQGGVPQVRSAEPHAHVYIRSPYGTFATSDGYLALAMPHLPTLGKVIGEDDFASLDDEEAGWNQRDEVFAKTGARLRLRSTEYWLQVLEENGIWCAPVYGYADVLADPQIEHNGTIVRYEHPTEGEVTTPGFPYTFSKTPPSIDRGAPLVGQHTHEVLDECGFEDRRVDELIANGVVADRAVR